MWLWPIGLTLATYIFSEKMVCSPAKVLESWHASEIYSINSDFLI